ncbi:IS110 family transposase [Desertimonas flava]|uniref:IS110 family transposase n=1 Tax=Desertimonas flava TaxID=2064846 RepID=UPI000E35727F|nr:IS110 family transposase [Desertimonas flava]
MSSMTVDAPTRKVIVGVDTHKHIHVAVAIDQHGARLGDVTVSADTGGYTELEQWAQALGRIDRFGIEGTGSYGAGLSSFLRRCGHRVVECNREDRRARRRNGKSDTVDAEAAARSVLAGTSTIVPKTGYGTVEMIRQIKVARDTARKGRTSAIITLKAIIVNAPAELRESLSGLPDKALLDRCAGFRPGEITDTTGSTKHALRSLAKRWLDLDAEITSHDRLLDGLTAQTSPTLRDGYGIGADTAAEMLIVFGDNPDRIRSEAAFAKLCGVCPIPASSGMTNKHRLYRGGHREANAALHRTVIVRMRFHQPTIDYAARRTAEGLSKKDIIRCLKRFLAREVYQRVMTDHATRSA